MFVSGSRGRRQSIRRLLSFFFVLLSNANAEVIALSRIPLIFFRSPCGLIDWGGDGWMQAMISL